ncbi:MAG: TIGR01777 family oxidoreductase [bacterium]
MKILVTGSSGLIGSALVTHLTGAGHYVVRLVRSAPNRDRGDVLWDPVSGKIERSKLEGMDAVVHLAGENIARRRWTKARKAKLVNSRVQATEFLAQTMAGLKSRPKVFVSASAIGYYGHRPTQIMKEEMSAGITFLSELCQEWERATQILNTAGIRVVIARFGIVLSRRGGALAMMRLPFTLGLGGTLGNGRQYTSWIAIDDTVRAILHVLEKDSLSGPVNVVAPNPVTNREFTKALGRVLSRPTLFPVPGFMLRLLLGGIADAALLASCRADPEKLTSSGFKFEYPDLDEALRIILGATTDGRR